MALAGWKGLDMNCLTCGYVNESEALFCGDCGTQLGMSGAPQEMMRRHSTLIQRLLGAALLKAGTYEEVEADRLATGQAMLVVVLASLATGIAFFQYGQQDVVGVVLGVIFALVGWTLLAWITYIIGTKVFPTEDTTANWGELARTLGFAQAPGVLRVLAVVPVIGPYIFLGASLWVLVCSVVAIRQALDYKSMWRAVGVTIASYIPTIILMTLISGPFS